MASGDAGGGVALWDARLGTRLAAFSRHRADVLALAASPDGAALFAAGVDSQVELHLCHSLQCAQFINNTYVWISNAAHACLRLPSKFLAASYPHIYIYMHCCLS